MKVKDLERTANIAWSPATLDQVYLAAGTAAQQLDATFSLNASLEIFTLNLSDPGMEMSATATIQSENRFHKVVWGSFGSPSGTIIGGCDGGVIQIYNAAKVLEGDANVTKQCKHTGQVHSLDFNPFQQNLLASGAAESEIYIWDMNNLSSPMTPGSKSQPSEDVLCIQWNKQVQHILASTFSSKCVVWDLRKNEPIIKLMDTVSRSRWKIVSWHPEVATQLCLASEEDQAPIIQLWDLRFATSPLKTFESHQRGVLSMAWCQQDSDLLISSGKDNRIVCWNVNSDQPGGEILSEVAKTNQWNFDITWCPKNPALIAAPGFDGHVSVYSLMGGKAQQIQTTNKIADSFPGMDGYVQAPVVQQNATPVSVDLKKAPKWLKKPVGAKFGFGGKLITFEHDKEGIAQAQQNAQPGQPAPNIPRNIHVSQVITEADLIDKSIELEKALEYGDFIEYCKAKAELVQDQHKRYIWYYLKANFEQNPRAELLNLLGYKIEDVNAKLNDYIDKASDVDDLADQFVNINRIDDYTASMQDFTDSKPGDFVKPKIPYKIKTGDDMEGLIAQALLLNNIEAAVELCLKSKKFADAIIIAMTGGADLLARTQKKYLQQTEGYLSSLISALVSEDWISVINDCEINSWKEALAAALTHASNEDLPLICELMGSRLEQESNGNTKLLQDAQLCYICAGSFEKLVSSWTKKAQNSNDDLQELVELVTFLQKSVERQGRRVEITGQLAELLSNYAFILASQGSLNTALNYLGNSQNEQVTNLRERLLVAIGQKPVFGQMQPRSRQNTTRSSFSGYTNQFAPANNNTFKPFNPPTNNPPNVPSWQQNNVVTQPPKAFSPAPLLPVAPTVLPPGQPARPPSIGASQGSSHLRSKYIVDPSVQSNQYPSNQFGNNPLVPPMSQSAMHNNFQTNALSNPPSNPYTPNNLMNPSSNVTQFIPPPVQQPSFGNVQSGNFNPVGETEVAQSAMNALPSSAAPGWNDPPVANRPSKLQTRKSDVFQQNPITQPIFGNNTMPSSGNGYDNQINQQQIFNPYGNVQEAPQVYQPPIQNQPPSFNNVQGGFNTNPINQQQFKPPSTNQDLNRNVAPVQEEIPPPIAKAPIPEEHIHMQTVLNALKKQCSLSANNPQTKRKLEDVGRKLETLYDCLREHKLSSNTLAMLHQIVQCVQHGDYTGGLNIHTQLVSGPDFAQIASFMPGLKVLLQCALQLQVYLR